MSPSNTCPASSSFQVLATLPKAPETVFSYFGLVSNRNWHGGQSIKLNIGAERGLGSNSHSDVKLKSGQKPHICFQPHVVAVRVKWRRGHACGSVHIRHVHSEV